MCIYCGSNKVDKTFIIKDRGWGSQFDLLEVRFPLCNTCLKKKIKKKWLTEKPNIGNNYLYENEILDLMDKIGIDKFENNIIDRTIVREYN